MRSELSRYCNSPTVRKNSKSDSRRAKEIFSQLEEKIDAYDRPSCFSSFDASISRMNLLGSNAVDRDSELDNLCIRPKLGNDRINNFLTYSISRSSYSRPKGFQSVSSSPDPTKSNKSLRYLRPNYRPGYITTTRDSKISNKRSLKSLRQSPVLSLEEEEDLIKTVKTKLSEHRDDIARQALNKYHAWNQHGIFPAGANKLRYQTLISSRMKKVYRTKYKSYYENAKNEYLELRTSGTETEPHERCKSTLLEKIEEVAVRKLPTNVLIVPRRRKKLDVADSIKFNLGVKLVERMVKPVVLLSDNSMSPRKNYI